MSQPLENDLFIRDDVDDSGRLSNGLFAGRSPDIIVVHTPSADPSSDFADLADTHEGDRIQPTRDHTIYVRVHNRGPASIEATVNVYWVRPNAARDAADTQAPAFDTSKWTLIGTQNVTVPAGSWAFASVTWAAAGIPAAASSPRIFDAVGFVALVSSGPELDDTGPELSELSDAASFWRFFSGMPASNNAAFRAVPYVPLFRFEPPGRVEDLGAPGDPMYEAWHVYINGEMRRAARRVQARLDASGGGTSQFINPGETPIDSDSIFLTVTWKGFPMKFLRTHRDDRERAWRAAEVFESGSPRNHDEYLEWFTHKRDGLITRVDFTAEAWDYWEFLYDQAALLPESERDNSKIVELYRRYIDPAVSFADLGSGSSYDKTNRWNTERGAMHLTNRPNNLQAEILLAADATILVNDGAIPINDPLQLDQILGFGAMWRSSDPRIGWDVNQLAREGFKITLANPVGLLIDDLDDSGFTKKDGSPAGNYWRVQRGFSGGTLRAVYEVPPSEGFVVGEMKIGGEPIRYGGQIAEHVTMKLVGQAWGRGSITNTPLPAPSSAIPVFGLLDPGSAEGGEFEGRLSRLA
jgi:hypothetical protein